MNSANIQAVPTPPSLMKALMAGFDAISSHVGLISFSILLDLALWFGPRLRLTQLFKATLTQPLNVPEMQNPDLVERLKTFLQDFNLFSVFRTYPVGIPSLMASRSPAEAPFGKLATWDLLSPGGALSLWLLLTIIGLVAGTLYFSLVAQAALVGKITWHQAVGQWPWACAQVALLAILWFTLLLIVLLPFSCFLSALLLSGFGLGQIALLAILVLGGVLIWLLIPLVFSPHGIFVYRYPVWASVKESVRLTRMTLPSTSMLFLVIILLSEGLDVLWNMPAERSWFMLVGIIGHAFITTSLLAASFVYYNDAGQWVKRLIQEKKLSTA
jgi:hypothetical protein